jgi:nanoRNase/pAp phosphatase (c-di-AMP/oligoRNAs hydrolase)
MHFMALTPEQQALEQITRAKRILVVSKQHASLDAVAATISCFQFIKKLGKDADIVIPDFQRETAPGFLPHLQDIKPTIGAMRAFNITLDVKEVPLAELMYDVRDHKLEITIVPKSGEWSPKTYH